MLALVIAVTPSTWIGNSVLTSLLTIGLRT